MRRLACVSRWGAPPHGRALVRGARSAILVGEVSATASMHPSVQASCRCRAANSARMTGVGPRGLASNALWLAQACRDVRPILLSVVVSCK